jgi:hypothetical protein
MKTKGAPSLLSYPDEIMIDWGALPVGSVASLYWPAVNAADVLQLAASLYPGHGLTTLDPHTLRCQVSSRVSYIPIPTGTGGSFAGLFTLQLPTSIHAGNEFDITVRRISTKQQPVYKPPQIQRQAEPAAVVPEKLEWRYVTGTFHMKVPVQKESAILPVDENLLSILEWRLTIIGPGNRWYPVLLRYIGVLKQRITGMGGDPNKIPPSPNGYQAPPHVHKPEAFEHCYTGKVTNLFFDQFGDFEGFDLRTEKGEEHSFRAFEHEIEELIYLAWVERFVMTVCVRACEGHPVIAVILRRAPRALRG